jgi:hypothetical protein
VVEDPVDATKSAIATDNKFDIANTGEVSETITGALTDFTNNLYLLPATVPLGIVPLTNGVKNLLYPPINIPPLVNFPVVSDR